MAEAAASGVVLEALLRGLSAQGQEGLEGAARSRATKFPVKGTIDVVALADHLARDGIGLRRN